VSLAPIDGGVPWSGRTANHDLSFRQFNKSKHAQYFTPVWLAELLFELLRPLCGEELSGISVFDPTCGSGRLLAPWYSAGAKVLGIELDELAARHAAAALGSTNVRTGDLLDYRNLVSNASLVLTNPPYGLWWSPPDKHEEWSCETTSGLIESQGATLEIATRSLAYNGLLVAIVPTSTFANSKDRMLRDVLYANYEGLCQVTLRQPFRDEYGIAVDADLLVARRGYRGYGVPWKPVRAEAPPDTAPDVIRWAFRQAFDYGSDRIYPSAMPSVPVVSRLVSVTPTSDVRITARGIAAGGDAAGLLAFLDATETAFDPVRGIEHGVVAATLSPASILTRGSLPAVESLLALGFEPEVSEADCQRIARLQKKYALLRTPLYPPRPHQRLAYLDDRSYTAKETVLVADGAPLFTTGHAYHLRPTWVRHRETASVETVFDESLKKNVELITSVDRGYLAFTVITDSGSRTFREIDVADVEILTRAFDLPEIPDLEAVLPDTIERNRQFLAARCPFLFPFQREDVARMGVKPFGYLGYEQGGGKTVTAAAWALLRGAKRVLVVCQSSLVENWLHELSKFGFTSERLTTHHSVSRLREERRNGVRSSETTFYVTSFEFLSLVGIKQYDPWACRSFKADGELAHEVLDNGKAACRVCKRDFGQVVRQCPQCNDAAGWTGGHCRACKYQAWTLTGDSRQWPAYKRIAKLFGAVLVDEAQIAKSKNTLRGRAVRSLKPKSRLILTGTLMKGYVHDVFWNVAWLLGFDTPLFPYAYRAGAKRFLSEFGTYEFVTRQFEESLHEGRAKLLPEVSNLNRFWRLMASFAVRRRKDEVFELPAKQRTIHVLPLCDPHGRLYRDYAEWAKEQIQKALRQNEANPNMGVIANALWKLRYAATCPVAVDYLDRGHLTQPSWNKLDRLTSIVRAAAERGEKTIVFSGLRTMVAAIAKHLREQGITFLPITADVPAAKRFALIQQFSRDPRLTAIVASLNCLNRGFTIVAANHVVLVDLEYSPEATEQAEDRVHRPGQDKPVYIHYLLSQATIDQVMHEVLIQKSEAIRHAIDGRERFRDVAELLRRVTGDVQLEIAKRLDLLPVIEPSIALTPLPMLPEIVPTIPARVDLPDESFIPPLLLNVRQLSLFD
jgi:hypothetical protein